MEQSQRELEGPDSLALTDVILPSQFFGAMGGGGLCSEQRLMLAVLVDAINILQGWNRMGSARKRRAFADELRAELRGLGGFTLAAATDGNHGRAVARVARLLGYRAHILVPRNTVPARIEAIAGEGAQTTVVDGTYDDAVAVSASLAADDVLVISDTSWPGYVDTPAHVIDGYATIFAEVDQQLGAAAPDVVVVQMGVGALAAAVVAHYANVATVVVAERGNHDVCPKARAIFAHSPTFVFDLTTNPNVDLSPPYDFLRFYLPVAALDQLAGRRGLRRAGRLRTTSLGIQDPVMQGLALSILPMFQGFWCK